MADFGERRRPTLLTPDHRCVNLRHRRMHKVRSLQAGLRTAIYERAECTIHNGIGCNHLNAIRIYPDLRAGLRALAETPISITATRMLVKYPIR